MKTYRYRGHSMSDAKLFKRRSGRIQKIDPITQVLDVIMDKKYATERN
jgi:pyruvate dehydrogenase E1 component alpha subunit